MTLCVAMVIEGRVRLLVFHKRISICVQKAVISQSPPIQVHYKNSKPGVVVSAGAETDATVFCLGGVSTVAVDCDLSPGSFIHCQV